MIFIRGLITACSRAAGKLIRFSASGRPGETISNREVLQQYGFASADLAGASCVMIEHQGHIICLATERPDKVPDQEVGKGWSVAVYKDKTHYIQFRNDGSVVINADKVTVEADHVELGGATGISKLVDERILATLNGHVHSCAAAGAPSGPPIALAPELPVGTLFTVLAHATNSTKAK